LIGFAEFIKEISAVGDGSGDAVNPIIPSVGILAANRTQYKTNTASITAPFTSRRMHYAHPDGDISDIQTVDLNSFLAGISTASNGPVHNIKRFIEYPQGVFTPVLWGGLDVVSLSAGGRIKSDIVAGLTIPAGEKFWERTVILTSGNIPVCVMPAASSAIGVDDGNISGDFGNSGAIGPTTGLNTIGCQAIVGTVNATDARSFVLLGDSLTFGALDITGSGPKGASGFVARMLDDHGYPYMKWCIGGQYLQNQVTMASRINADIGQFNFSDFIIASGLNDLSLGSRTKAQVLADIQTMATQTNVAGKRVWKTTITPRSSSTDSWATVENQLPRTDGNMADLIPLNADIRAGLPNVYGFIDAADAAMSARDSGIHKAPPAGTTDGTHFNSVRAELISSLIGVEI
jgi:hypothetical protein